MSFALAVWDADRPPRVPDVAGRYQELRQGRDRAAPSPRVTAFVQECERRWPDEAGGAGPWAVSPFAGGRAPTGLVVDIRSEAATAMFGDWAEMAERHGLVLYDPQSGVVKIPSRLSFAAEPPPMKRLWSRRR